MNNSNASEKSKGVLLFAFNSTKVDYVAIADNASRLITKATGLPITIVTDHDAVLKFDYDTIIRSEGKAGNTRMDKDYKPYEWKNLNRYQAYELSPYNETILLDTDYLVLDDTLLTLLAQPFDYRLMYQMQTPEAVNLDEMSPASLPMVWATVVMFRKTPNAKMFFDMVGRIQRNYAYYRSLFSITQANFRNDFAFSMANIILNGYSIPKENNFPWPMVTIERDITSMEVKDKFLVIKYSGSADVVSRQNLHIMDKDFLVSAQFNKFVESICNE
jgi:hypothetical protein